MKRFFAILRKKTLHFDEGRGIALRGSLEARKILPDGTRQLLWVKDNLVVFVGVAQVALLWGDATGLPFTKGQIGSDNTAPADGDTGCKTPLDEQTGAFSRETTTITNDTAKLVSQHTAPGGGWSVKEYCARTSGGTAFNRVIFTAIPLNESEVLEFTYKNQVKRSA
jgi:hypothetical protein